MGEPAAFFMQESSHDSIMNIKERFLLQVKPQASKPQILSI